MSTGRYWIIDWITGKKKCVEPIAERSQRTTDKEWEVGGAQQVEGGAIRREDSIISSENGFVNIEEKYGSGN